MSAGDLPDGFGVALAADTRVLDGGRVLIGGAPLRVIRLTPAGADLAAAWSGPAGGPVPASASARRLARRLLDAGVAHPRPGRALLGPGDVTLVVPVRDRVGGLTRLLAGLAGAGPAEAPGATILVDDGSEDDVGVAGAAARFGARLFRSEVSSGPGAARNRGWREAGTAAVAFLDTDCTASPGWTAPLLAHLNDPAVAVAAPRVAASPGAAPSWLAAYETARSPLDLGAAESPVRPRSRVSYVPAAALVARRSALEEIGGFDESLAMGEDVDLVWRLSEAGWTVRYEPAVEVLHDCRGDLRAWLAQRYGYGTSAAELDRRHPGAAAPLTVSPWTAAAWGLAGAGWPGAGAAVAATTTALLAPRLEELEHPWAEAARIAGHGHLAAGRLVADAVRRSWWPAALAAAAVSRRARRTLALAAVLPPLWEWTAGARPLDPARWSALRLADDLAYGAGVWAGCARARRWGALRPDLAGWPGRPQAVEPGG